MRLVALRALKAARGLASPLGRRGLRLGVGAAEEHRRALHSLGHVDLVLDVGANRGQFALLSRSVFPDARIEAWEPLDAPRETMGRLFDADAGVTIHPVALGEASGEAVIYETVAADSSSLLRPVGAASVARVRRTTRVQIVRMDDLAIEGLDDGCVLLKLDVQGYEDRVLAGAPATLAAVNHVLVELTFGDYYEGQASASDVLGILFEARFELRDIHNMQVSAGITQADVLLTRRETP